MYKIVFTQTAKKSIKKLDPRYTSAVNKALDKLSRNPKLGEPLKAELKGYWRIRFSRYRIIYKIKQRRMIIIIFEIRHRKDVYR